MNGPPDAGKYEALIEQLSELERRASSAEIDALTASYYALYKVIYFLQADARVLERQATRPLWSLVFAIHDLTQGARPKLLFGPRDRKGAKGAPSYTSAIVLRALVNLAFKPLLKGGMPKEEAGHWLAAELKHSGIRQRNGKEITASQIIRWRAEFGAKSLQGSDEVLAMFFHEARRTLDVSDGGSIDRPQAQLAARLAIRMLRIDGF
jgi:hypothetical protein